MKLSAAVIVKNEEEHLPRLLKSIVGKFDEIVVVDTGSTDRTIEIAKGFGCKVFTIEWSGFADARNYAISKCSGEWIWHFDADFELENGEFEKCLQIIGKMHNANIDALTIYVKNFNAAGIVAGISSQAFIHRNKQDVYWIGNIHEILNIKESLLVPIYVNHYGYQTKEVLYQKALRNLTLIKKDLYLQNGKEEYLKKLFYLFQSFSLIVLHTGALPESIEKYIDDFLHLQKRYAKDERLNFFANYTLYYIANIFLLLNKKQEAQRFLQLAFEADFYHPDLLYMQTKIFYEDGLWQESKDTFLRCLEEVSAFEKHKNRAGVVDNIENIWLFMERDALNLFELDDFDPIYKKWKKNRSAFYSVLLLQIAQKYDQALYLKLSKKMEKIYFDHERILSYLLRTNKQNSLSIAQKIVKLNPKNSLANRVLALYYYQNREYKTALKYFTSIIFKDFLLDIFPQFIDTLQRCGYQKEAENLLKSLKK